MPAKIYITSFLDFPMKKFIVIYYASANFDEMGKNMSQEDHKKGMEKWMQWAEKCGSGLVDMGAPLGTAQKIKGSISMPSDKNVVGYSVLQAESMEDAQEMMKNHPHFELDQSCEIEVYECMPLPGQ